jgi:uncharacterized protein (TIGR04255 family)
MTKVQKNLISYKKPPVIEVVCGILFKPINALLAPHFGLLWEEFKNEYPTCQEASPLAPIIEKFEQAETAKLNIELLNAPPLPRIWFIDSKENGIIQVQRDRFLHNWRKIQPDDEYPRYYNVIESFMNYLSRFESFLQKNQLGEIVPLQYELTYVNHVPKGEGWESIKEIGKLFPDFVFRDTPQRFLPQIEGVNWQTSFALPNRVGRLHITIRNALHQQTKQPIFSLELTVRGIEADKSSEGMEKWFDTAHEWIVYGFADITDVEVQKKIWKRID